MKTKVDLHPASVWDCDNCGRENFVRSIVAELDPNDPEDAEFIEYAKSECEGTSMSPGGFWMTTPDEVKCAFCGEEFETINDRDGFDL